MQVVGTELHGSRDATRRRKRGSGAASQLRKVPLLADWRTGNEVTPQAGIGGGSRITSAARDSAGPAAATRTSCSHALVEEPTIDTRRQHLDDEGGAPDAASTTAARFVTATGTAEGNPAIRAGTHLRLSGLSPRFNNTYYVTHCCHRFDLERGYETDFTAESAFLGRP